MRESLLQSLIVKSLKQAGWLVIHIPNQATRGVLNSAGILPGAPDLLCLRAGQVVFLELKSPSGRLSEKQKAVVDAIKGQGFDVRVVRTLEDIDDLLR